MFKSVVFRGNEVLGEVEMSPQNNGVKLNRDDHIRITNFSPPSERCPPLAVLHTITSSGLCFKMESVRSQPPDPKLIQLHNCCLKENKTAVVALGEEELHLVAMYSKMNERQHPCFWGYYVKSGLYDSCLVMLNIRCLGIVFDLDETLIVANTMRSFEDRIESLQKRISTELDPTRLSGMLAEAKRYQDDKAILKQFVENDQIVENEELIRVQSEIVPALSDNHAPLVRPVIRLQEKNIVLTRINPQAEFKSSLVDGIELQFCMEVWFGGEKVGDGIGRTRREAQIRAAEASLMQLADRYIKRSKVDLQWDGNDVSSFGDHAFNKDEATGHFDPRTDSSRKATTSVSALKEFCMVEGLTAIYQKQPQYSINSSERDEVYTQVEIDGQVMGKGVGLTWEEARMQAAERALVNLKASIGQFGQKRQGSPRSFQGMSSKRSRPDFQRNFQRMPPARYTRNASPIP
ncbi:hypothetical protein QQ045_007185 [Rhodiola kirilowii]